VKTINKKILERFIRLAGERLSGDWVVMGGVALLLQGAQTHPTYDIDVAGPADATNEQLLQLMSIAEELGLPAEAINQAAAYFLYRVHDWRQNLIELHRGKNAIIHVPNTTLLLLLKMARLTESDLADCLAALRLATGRGEQVDLKRLRRAIDSELHKKCSTDRTARLRRLREALSSPRRKS